MSPRGLRIFSGGQTGVDRGALDAALAAGVACGGWCPAGRLAEDGVIDPRYPLQETNTEATEARTRRNAEEADGTLILDFDPSSPGTRLTREYVIELGKPLLVVERSKMGSDELVDKIVEFVECCDVRTLNVAGPRASESSGAYLRARRLIEQVLRTLDVAKG